MNLVIATVGDNSLHKEWIKESPNFDLVLLYYGDNPDKAISYTDDTPHVYSAKGFKWWLIKSFLEASSELTSKYEYIWFPDDDISISTKEVNSLFSIAKEYDLWLCQPSLRGYVSHQITLSQPDSLLRYTNFVEVMSPLMSLNTVNILKETFDINYSSWGLDGIWPYMLGNPTDKVAIIDSIIMTHTKPVGNPALYSKIPHTLQEDEALAYDKFTNGTRFPQTEHSKIKL